MAFTITSGGSLTTALSLTILAWGIRALRGAALRSILEDTSQRFNLRGLNFLLSRILSKRRGRHCASVAISPEAFETLVEESPVPFVVFKVFREVRERGLSVRRAAAAAAAAAAAGVVEDAKRGLTGNGDDGGIDGESSRAPTASAGEDGGDPAHPASSGRGILDQVRCLPEHALKDLLVRSVSPRALNGSGDPLNGRATSGPPSQHRQVAAASTAARDDDRIRIKGGDLVVLLSDDEDRHIQQLTSYFCDVGYRCVYVEGGIQALKAREQGDGGRPPAPGLTRDALFALMYLFRTSQIARARAGPRKGAPLPPRVRVLDVRRHDELSLFGSFEGSDHLPCLSLPHALHLSAEDWKKRFRHPKPDPEDVLVLTCNDGTRSRWCAGLLRDEGYAKVYFCGGGTNAWHLDPTMCEYQSYEYGADKIPTPELFALEEVDFERGQGELARNGLMDDVAGAGPL